LNAMCKSRASVCSVGNTFNPFIHIFWTMISL
jgi:hypothetical protein